MNCYFSYSLNRPNSSSFPRFCVLARTQIVRCCCFLSMTKHRTISQQQLHNDVRLVFPRNNCLLKLAALLPALQMPASRRRAASSAAFVLCVYVVHIHTQTCIGMRVFVCLYASLCSCVVLNSFKCPTRNFISIRNPVSDASRSPSTSLSQSSSSSS